MECENTMEYNQGHMRSFRYDRIRLFILIILTQEFLIYLACPWNTINRSTIRNTHDESLPYGEPYQLKTPPIFDFWDRPYFESKTVHIWDYRLTQTPKSCTFASCICLYNKLKKYFNEFNDTVKRLLNINPVSELL